MAKRALTDRALKSLKPAPAGQRYEVMDTIVPGLGARVTSNGTITMMLLARYPGSSNPTRRALGKYSPLRDADRKAAEKDYDALPAEQREHLTLDQYLLRTYGPTTLAGARSRARQWKEMIRRGKDPAIEEERARDTEARKRANAFAAVAEDFIAEKLPGERKGKEVERDIRREFIPPWGKRPITELTRRDIRDIIDAKKQIAPAQARNLLGLAKRLFAWAVDQDRYGLEASPADTLKPTKIIGDKVAGKQILDDAELFALWRAAKRTPYPVGPIYQLLILSALRLNEVADASWPEVKLRDRMWTIPPSA